ncbi:DUF881 domain-containing protein [Oerskovia paurometabola]|uniref:DUF881 domain-containing protein n=1 Tax=Oerskovia paurometabola TaxID=162170 RepID=UPI0038242C8E
MTTSSAPEDNDSVNPDAPSTPATSAAPQDAAAPRAAVPGGPVVPRGPVVRPEGDAAVPADPTADEDESAAVVPSEPDAAETAVEHVVDEVPIAPPAGPATAPPVAERADVAPVTDDPVTVQGEQVAEGTEPLDEAPAAQSAPDGHAVLGEAAPVSRAEPLASSPPASPDRPHGRHEAEDVAPASSAPKGTESPAGWSKLGRAMRPQVTRSQLLAGLLCALLGFALAVQVSQTQEQQLSSLRQSDLVRLLDDVTQRANALETRVEGLQDTRDELSSGSGQQRAALELAQRQSETQGILSGRLPAEGPGITLTITETDERIPAHKLFNILEELRNAGVEVVEVNGIRLVTSSYFEETSRGMVVDGQKIASPYQWKAIGDPSTLETALEIPGGAMSSVRNEGASPKITQEDLVTISSTREPETPEFATPVPAEGGN